VGRPDDLFWLPTDIAASRTTAEGMGAPIKPGRATTSTHMQTLAELTAVLDLRDAIHVGHSTGGGEVARYICRTEPSE